MAIINPKAGAKRAAAAPDEESDQQRKRGQAIDRLQRVERLDRHHG